MGRLRELNRLILQSNNLTQLPRAIGKKEYSLCCSNSQYCENWRDLHLKSVSISGQLSQLQYLSVGENYLSFLPEEVILASDWSASWILASDWSRSWILTSDWFTGGQPGVPGQPLRQWQPQPPRSSLRTRALFEPSGNADSSLWHENKYVYLDYEHWELSFISNSYWNRRWGAFACYSGKLQPI